MTHIATTHYRDDRWIEIQHRQLTRHTPEPYRVYAAVEGIDHRRSLANWLQRSRMIAPVYRLGPEAKWWIERRLRRFGSREVARPRVSEELRRRLLADLEPEIAGLEEVSGWNLGVWRA